MLTDFVKLCFLFCTVTLPVLCGDASNLNAAQIFYVAPDGNDANPGSETLRLHH